MKALTIHQPYASWIINGQKWVENRSWGTYYRGRLAVHAGLETAAIVRLKAPGSYPLGVVLGTVHLAACFLLAEVKQFQQERPKVRIPGTDRFPSEVLRHAHTEGPWVWIFQDVVKFPTPIPATGRQRLWEWDEAPTWSGR